jgi:hypothetical protein
MEATRRRRPDHYKEEKELLHTAMMIDERVLHYEQEPEINDYNASHFYELHVMFILFLACPDWFHYMIIINKSYYDHYYMRY